MELEFRNKHGEFLLSFKGQFAKEVQRVLYKVPEMVKIEKTISGKGTFVVYKVVKKCGYTFFGTVELILPEGSYIKIIH